MGNYINFPTIISFILRTPAMEETSMYRNYLTFGDLLRAHRILQGISQEELSETCDYLRDRSCISKLERKIRKPKPKTVEILAAGLNLKGRQKALFQLLGRIGSLSRYESFVFDAIINHGDMSYAKAYARTT